MVNPHSGPGATPLPDANYTREIPALNAFPNVRTVGYVSTAYSKRDLTAVLSDVATYSNWIVNSSMPGLGVQGIFFDETPNQYDSASASFLAAANQAVKTAAGLSPLNLVSFTFFSIIQGVNVSQPRHRIAKKKENPG